MSATVYALINQKGGVGKTTETINLARVASNAGRRCLVIDADPQGNASGVLSLDHNLPDRIAFADVLAGENTIPEVAVEGIWPGLSLVPGNRNTDKATRALHGEHGREHRLREAVEAVRSKYDLILIDCAPSLELHTVNALTAADFAIVIAEPGKFSLDGLGLLQDSFASIQRYYNPGLEVAGIVINAVRNTVGHRAWIRQLDEEAPWPIIAPRIPFWTVVQDAQEAGYGLDEWPVDTHRARQAYDMYALHYDMLRKNRVKKGR